MPVSFLGEALFSDSIYLQPFEVACGFEKLNYDKYASTLQMRG